MGCSQVFDERGEGLKFLLHPVESPVFRGKNPFMSKEDARRLFEKVREVYQKLNDRPLRRIVVHKTTHFTSDEMSGIATALSNVDDIELLQIQQDTHWRAIAFDSVRNSVSGFPVKRGIPSPLLIRRFRGRSALEQVGGEVLRLTKMNWNNHQLYSRLPVTISFSSELAEIAKHIDKAWPGFYDFRYFM